MIYVLAITGANFGSQNAYLAYQFAEKLLAHGHEISQIFFLQNGVTNANQFINLSLDEINLLSKWQELYATYQVPLHLCITASQRRGITNASMAQPFVLAGLGEFSQAVMQADRLIQF